MPLALLSHFTQDAIPHFGYAGHGGYKQALKHRMQKAMMLADPVAFIPFLAILLGHHASFWVYAAAFLALSPDFHDFIAYFVFHKQIKDFRFSRFASFIQWCERPWGVAVEIIWYVGGSWLLLTLIT